MRDETSVSTSSTPNDDFDDTDTSDDRSLWRKASFPGIVASPRVKQSRCTLSVSIALIVICLLSLIIAMSVGNTKADRRLSAVEKIIANLSETFMSLNSQQHEAETRGHETRTDISQMEYAIHNLEQDVQEISESIKDVEQLSTMKETLAQLKCNFNKFMDNDTSLSCCRLGWISFTDHCYFFSGDGLSWYAARDKCRSMKAELLILKSKEERVFVIRRTIPLYFWLGLTDAKTGDWEWIDETPYTIDRSEWLPGQPDDWEDHGLGGGEDCAHFHRDGRYNDDHCSRNYRYVCKASALASEH